MATIGGCRSWAEVFTSGCIILGFAAASVDAADSLGLELRHKPDQSGVEVRLQGVVPKGTPMEARVQRSVDLRNWSPVGAKVRLASQATADGLGLVEDRTGQGFFRLSTQPTTFTSSEGGEILGYLSSFQDQLDALGNFSQADFAKRFAIQGAYVNGLSWDPTQALYWDALQKSALKITPPELALLQTNGFVVTERLGNHSFGDIYYGIFTQDLPVFVTTDSILHAWHRSFDAVLQEMEETSLSPKLRSVLLGMLNAMPAVRAQYGDGVLKESVADADYFLSVAAALLGSGSLGPPPPPAPPEPMDSARVQQTLKLINELSVAAPDFSIFEPTGEWVDFSQYRPRGHYAKRESLSSYFRTMMWLGRVNFRVAGPKGYASARQLGTTILLNRLLDASGQRGAWRQIHQFISKLIGPPDSMDLDQLGTLLREAGIRTPGDIRSSADLEAFRQRIEETDLGRLAIGSTFLSSAGADQVKLPRACTFLGQRFTVDSWTLSRVVYDQILLPGSQSPPYVRRRLPYCLDTAFAVFANDQVVPELLANMVNPAGVPFRDGFPYQHNLAAARLTLDLRSEKSWKSTVYDHWLWALRTLSTPTLGAEYPEAMRTRAWAMKTLNTQLASWTQLRHDTLLYVKQSETPPTSCLYPYGFVEPRPEFFDAMNALALQAAQTLDTMEYTGIHPIPGKFFRDFAGHCRTLSGIARKQLAQQPLDTNQVVFLEDTIEQQLLYLGERQYNGWYPSLFYWGNNGDGVLPTPPGGFQRKGPDHDCVFPDLIVADVHTDWPSELDGDPGAILYEGVGLVNLMIIAVDNGPDRMVYAGPVMSHYEFTQPFGALRMTDEEWKASVYNGAIPAPPPWTKAYLAPK